MTDIRVPMKPMLDAFGIAATVTRPDDTPIETRVIWLGPRPDLVPTGTEFQRRDPIRIVALDVDGLPTVPRGTLIEAAERDGAAVETWKVDALLESDPDHHRVIVVKLS